ncbi:MAG TPA: hypothetical protein DDY77_00740 [Clostridiales bacterium]|nr:hypothetical protein [Clostridiales bacterium]
MVLPIIVALCSSLLIGLSVLLKPERVKFEIYPIVPIVGALVLAFSGSISFKTIFSKLTEPSAANPLKVVVLFISTSLISVFLDETGFFEALASFAAKKAGNSQFKIFFTFYITVSVLTVFTSNDIVILTFTPFILQFAKRAGIDPKPYVMAEFVAANTWSMLFLIGNPTNVYLTSAAGIDFFTYLSVMWLPTIFAGLCSLLALLILFCKKLKKPLDKSIIDIKLKDKPLAMLGVIVLGICTVTVAISSYMGLEMWYVSAISCAALYVVALIVYAVRKEKPIVVTGGIKRAPWQMAPLVIGMFVIVLALDLSGFTELCAKFFGDSNVILKYGITSALSANLLNNIPMSVLFASISSFAGESVRLGAVYATVIGSNIGAFFTPLGALAGLMFSSIVNKNGVKFTFADFCKYGFLPAVFSLFGALGGLMITL